MKHKFIIGILSFTVMVFCMSFSVNPEVQKSDTTPIAQQSGWGQWKTASCFKYLKYRVKKKSYENEWAIEFKNGYNKSISMSVEIVDGYGGDRFTISSGDSQIRSAYYTNNKQATYINFNVDKVKFGDTSWGGPYANCDH